MPQAGRLRATYDYMKALPDIRTVEAPPFLPVEFVKRTVGNVTSFDAGRGCPFQCSFCTSRLTFYAKYASSLVRKHTALYRRWRMLERVCRKIELEDPNRLYRDRALLPCDNETGEDWRLYTQAAAAETAVDRERRVAGKKAILSPAY
jgi:hypothetical protein